MMNENTNQPNPLGRREERRAYRWERRAERRGGEWMLGIILILLAGIVFLQTQHIYIINNWWALFILLPAFGSIAAAWGISRAAGGQFPARARGSLIVGVLLLLVTAMFLFNLNWVIWGPVLLALTGISLIVNGTIK
jgi:peptidoglycan/LPS O-acetylase OafA/YrhL